jgi:hypothetical protein
MDGVLDWGLDFIRGVQAIASPALTFAVSAFTQLGSEYFYIIALASSIGASTSGAARAWAWWCSSRASPTAG